MSTNTDEHVVMPVKFPFFVLSDDPAAIFVGDVLRVFVLIAAFILMATLIRIAHQLSQYKTTRWRLLAYSAFLFSVAGTEYTRIGDPVSSRLPINFAAVCFTLLAVHAELAERLKKPPTAIEE